MESTGYAAIKHFLNEAAKELDAAKRRGTDDNTIRAVAALHTAVGLLVLKLEQAEIVGDAKSPHPPSRVP